MKPINAHLASVFAISLNLACAGEGHSGVQKPKMEPTSMPNARSRTKSEDSGQLLSQHSRRKDLSVSVDVAATTLHFVPMEKDFKVAWKKGESCDRIEIKESDSGLEVKHVDQDGSCGESKVEIWISDKISTQFVGGTGHLNIKGTGKVLESVDTIKAVVSAGQIDSDTKSINIERQWSQMTARYDSDKNSGLHLSMTLGSGSILFSM